MMSYLLTSSGRSWQKSENPICVRRGLSIEVDRNQACSTYQTPSPILAGVLFQIPMSTKGLSRSCDRLQMSRQWPAAPVDGHGTGTWPHTWAGCGLHAVTVSLHCEQNVCSKNPAPKHLLTGFTKPANPTGHFLVLSFKLGELPLTYRLYKNSMGK